MPDTERVNRPDRDPYRSVMDAIAAGTMGDLESLSTIVDGFPRGKDDRWERYWITHAIDAGFLEAIQPIEICYTKFVIC